MTFLCGIARLTETTRPEFAYSSPSYKDCRYVKLRRRRRQSVGLALYAAIRCPANSWPRGAASRHTTAPISQTRPSPGAYACCRSAVGGRVPTLSAEYRERDRTAGQARPQRGHVPTDVQLLHQLVAQYLPLRCRSISRQGPQCHTYRQGRRSP